PGSSCRWRATRSPESPAAADFPPYGLRYGPCDGSPRVEIWLKIHQRPTLGGGVLDDSEDLPTRRLDIEKRRFGMDHTPESGGQRHLLHFGCVIRSQFQPGPMLSLRIGERIVGKLDAQARAIGKVDDKHQIRRITFRMDIGWDNLVYFQAK